MTDFLVRFIQNAWYFNERDKNSVLPIFTKKTMAELRPEIRHLDSGVLI